MVKSTSRDLGFDGAIEETSKILRRANLSRDDTLALYQGYVSRFVNDNSNIWTADSIFIPASFAALAVYFSISSRGWLEFASLLFISMSLGIASHFIAEGHRRLQDRSLVVIRAIEGLVVKEQGKLGTLSPGYRLNVPRIKYTRRGLMVILIVSWLVALVEHLQ